MKENCQSETSSEHQLKYSSPDVLHSFTEVITRPSGGRWRYDLKLEATEPDVVGSSAMRFSNFDLRWSRFITCCMIVLLKLYNLFLHISIHSFQDDTITIQSPLNKPASVAFRLSRHLGGQHVADWH